MTRYYPEGTGELDPSAPWNQDAEDDDEPEVVPTIVKYSTETITEEQARRHEPPYYFCPHCGEKITIDPFLRGHLPSSHGTWIGGCRPTDWGKHDERRCGTCLFWESLRGHKDPWVQDAGSCNWVLQVKAPMWLSPPGALMRPQCLAGSGRDCEAWEQHP